jgi:hypothetical protein
MKKIGFLLLLFIVLSRMAFAQQEGVSTTPSQEQVKIQPQQKMEQLLSRIATTFEAANKWLSENNLSITTSPEGAFINDYILIAAEGLPSPNAKTPAQKRLTAERAATVLAYRQLAEFLEGVAVVGDTLVRDVELRYDAVRSAVAGFVKGAQIVYKDWNPDEEVALVIIKVGMTGPKSFGALMYEKLLGTPNIKKDLIKPESRFKTKPVLLEENYDGLIIDATEVDFKPALFARIFTPKGEILYDPSKVDRNILEKYGCAEYTNSIEKAKEALEKRGVKNPLIVKAIGIEGSPSDLQISEEDALKIYSANQKSNFLASAKVAFVLK